MAFPDFSAYVLQNGTGTIAGAWGFEGSNLRAWQPLQTNGLQIVAAGDFNNDAIPDLVLQNSSNTIAGIWEMGFNLETGQYAPTTWNPLPSTNGLKIVGAGTFGGSDLADLVLQDPTNQVAGVWITGTTGTPATPTPVEWIPLPSTNGLRIAGAGYFSADTLDDIVLQSSNNQVTGIWNIVPVTGGGGLSVDSWNPLPSTNNLFASVITQFPTSSGLTARIALQDASNTVAGQWTLEETSGSSPVVYSTPTAWDVFPSTNSLRIGPSLLASSSIFPPVLPV